MTPTREKFNKAIEFITRNGVQELVNYLENDTDFFTAPSSCSYHGNFIEGLLQHSVNVLEFALLNFNMLVKKKPEYEHLRESLIISAIFHDVCKTNQYKITEKWTKDGNNKWQSYQGYEVDDKLPLPHGPKSVFLISKFIKLTDIEAIIISWHMGQTDIVQPDTISKYAYNKALENPIVKLLIASDLLATSIEDTIDWKSTAKN
jgi:hypothetical protein